MPCANKLILSQEQEEPRASYSTDGWQQQHNQRQGLHFSRNEGYSTDAVYAMVGATTSEVPPQ
jgi:hypothetical protein